MPYGYMDTFDLLGIILLIHGMMPMLIILPPEKKCSDDGRNVSDPDCGASCLYFWYVFVYVWYCFVSYSPVYYLYFLLLIHLFLLATSCRCMYNNMNHDALCRCLLLDL